MNQLDPLAHISEDGSRKQPLADHLNQTAALAGAFAAAFGAQEEARYAGLLHDIGKDSKGFQKRLHGGARVDHSTAGARIAYRQQNAPAAFAIAGHHTGLPDGGHYADDPEEATLCGRVKRTLEPLGPWACAQTPAPAAAPAWAQRDNVTLAFFIRMLYSCLVDADFIDTETFMNGTPAPRGTDSTVPELLAKVRAKAGEYLSASPSTAVVQKRCEVLRACCERGRSWPQGLYTLTVPTGGGKTFASMAFAMEHAAAHGMKRVIYVIPYTSIIDQTVQVFSQLLGEENVLAHYSCTDYKTADRDDLTPAQYRQLLASENWDAPVIVTTAVQFFESLYSNRSSRCRKLHNLAESVIIFDEAQTLPNDYLKPCVSAIAQLVQHYHTTAVLCTATQPVLEPFFREAAPGLALRELCPDPPQLYQALRRVTLQDLGTVTAETLCAQLAGHKQVLCVVNRRKTAQELFAALPGEGSYCLTTLLCAADRRRQLEEIRQRLRDGLPCRVVSTSLIEAGVDVDFPTAYRERAGLDSILQTAGRCNREGRRSAGDSTVFFFCLDGCTVPPALRMQVGALDTVTRHYAEPDSPEAIQTYFQNLYRLRPRFDKKEILKAFQVGRGSCALPFAQVAQDFRLIETETRTVYLPIGEGDALCQQLRSGAVSRTLLRKLGVYSVDCRPQQFDALDAAGALELLPNGSAILTDPTRYDPHTGLALDVESGAALFF